MSVPSSEMLETPPGYPFEEIDYADIDVEEVRYDIWGRDLFIYLFKFNIFIIEANKFSFIVWSH